MQPKCKTIDRPSDLEDIVVLATEVYYNRIRNCSAVVR